MARLVVLIGSPVGHSLSPRMQNAAFAARGLDWRYEALEVAPEQLETVVHALEAGANVTAPYKQDVARIVGSELPSVNTLVVRGDGIEAFSTDAAVLEGLEFERAAIIGDGGAAAAFRHALPDARVFSRRGDWPPEVEGCDLVVNATPVRDEVLARLGATRRSSTFRTGLRDRCGRERLEPASSTGSRCLSPRARRSSLDRHARSCRGDAARRRLAPC